MTGIWHRFRRGRQPELTCVELVELVTDYLEGALAETERDRFDAHLQRMRRLHELRRADPAHDRGRRQGRARRPLRDGASRSCSPPSAAGPATERARIGDDEGMSAVEIVVVPDAEAAAAAAAALLSEVASADGSIVLAGGSTPRRAYELAAEAHSDWGGVEVWFGDDRCVPAGDPRSNQLLVREALLDRLVVPPTVHPIATDGSRRSALLPPTTRPSAAQPLDLVLLGPRAGRAHGIALPRRAGARRARAARGRGRARARAVRRADHADDPGARDGRARRLPGGRRGEGRRCPTGVRRGAVAGDAGEPRALARRADDGDPRPAAASLLPDAA